MRVNVGADYEARALGGDTVGDNGTTTSAPAATTVTDTGKAWTVNKWAGHIVVMGNNVFGVVLSNTATVLTIDMWHGPATALLAVTGGTFAGETAAATPATGTYVILPGQAPAWYMGLSVTAAAPAATDTFLNNAGSISELWAANGGLNRSRAAYAHTTSATSYTLSFTYQMVAADGASVTLQKLGIFPAQVTAVPTAATSGPMFLETAIPSPPTLIPGDSVANTESVNI